MTLYLSVKAALTYLMITPSEIKKRDSPKQEIDLIKSRLKKAEEHYAEWSKKEGQ